jgi:hypothetical protein
LLKLKPRASELAEQLAEIVPVQHEADRPALELLGMTFARLEAVADYIAEHGLSRTDGSTHPVLNLVSAWERNACRLLDRLGMTSAGRADLGLVVARAQEIQAGTLDYSRLSDDEVEVLRGLVEKATP